MKLVNSVSDCPPEYTVILSVGFEMIILVSSCSNTYPLTDWPTPLVEFKVLHFTTQAISNERPRQSVFKDKERQESFPL